MLDIAFPVFRPTKPATLRAAPLWMSRALRFSRSFNGAVFLVSMVWVITRRAIIVFVPFFGQAHILLAPLILAIFLALLSQMLFQNNGVT